MKTKKRALVLLFSLCCAVAAFSFFTNDIGDREWGNVDNKVKAFSLEETDIFRIWAKDADFLGDTYYFDGPIEISLINDPENEEAGEGINSTWHTNFAVFKDIDFGYKTISAMVRKGYPRGSKLELWIDRNIDKATPASSGGTLIGSVEFSASTTDWTRWGTFEVDIDPVSGVHDLCLVFLAGGGSAENQNYGALNWIDFITERAPETGGGDSDITYNKIPDNIHRTSTHFSVSANGVDLPVVDGLYTVNGQRSYGFLEYDYTTFSAPSGTVTFSLTYLKGDINSIFISPLKLEIVPRKVSNNTYEFEIPEPIGEEQYYLIANVNGNRLVIARDPQETDVPESGKPGVFNVADRMGELNPADQNNTVAVAEVFQSAVDAASEYGAENQTQGVVYVPEGLYFLGNLLLKSNTALYLAPGAVLRFSDYHEHYTRDYYKQSLARHGTWWICTEEDSENIKIYGRGTIDGNGHYHQKDKPSDVEAFANHVLVVMGTKNFLFDGPIIKETAFWGTIVVRSSDVTFRNVKFLNSMDANENDGIDVCESQRVTVDKAIGIALDDPFSTKTWQQDTDICPKWYGAPQDLDDVTFRNCVALTYCGAFKCGHGAMQKQSNILVENGVVVYAGRAIGIEPKYSGDDGDKGYRNITFKNIDVEDVGGEGWLKILANNPAVGNPPLKDVLIKDVNIRKKGSPGSLLGYDENSMVEGVTFDNITMHGNVNPVTSLTEMNILNKGFYKDVVFIGASSPRENMYRIEAEYFNTSDTSNSHTVFTIAESDDAEGSSAMVTDIKNENYLVYREVDFGSNTSTIKLRMKPFQNFEIEFLTDCTVSVNRDSKKVYGGKKHKTFAVSSSSTWTDIEIPFEDLQGTHDLFIVFKSTVNQNLCEFNWFELTREFYDIEGVNISDVEVFVNQSKEIIPEFTPENSYDKRIEWSVIEESEEGVISVNQKGVVRGLKPGTAKIQVTSTIDNSILSVAEVSVTLNSLSSRKVILPEEVDLLGGVDWQGNTGITLSGGRLNGLWQNNYAVFKDIDFEDYSSSLFLNYEIPRESYVEVWADRQIEDDGTIWGGVYLGGAHVKTENMGWGVYDVIEVPLMLASGVHDMFLVFTAAGSTATDQQFGGIGELELETYYEYPITSISIEPSSITLDSGATFTLSPKILPAEAANQPLSYSIVEQSIEGVITLNGQEVKAGRVAGTAKVRVACPYDETVYAILEVTVEGNAETFRIWAKDADFLGDTYYFDSPIEISPINDPENEEEGDGINSTWHTNFAVFKDIDFGYQTVSAMVRKGYPRGSKLELWIDRNIDEDAPASSGGTLIGSVEFSASTTDWTRWGTFEVDIDPVSGVHDLCLVFLAGGGSAENQNYGALNWIDFVVLEEPEGNGLIENNLGNLKVYPNPVADVLTIAAETEILAVKLSDMKGSSIYADTSVNSTLYRIDMKSYQGGLYLLEVITENGSAVYKIMKK